MTLKIRFLTATEDPRETERIAEQVRGIDGVMNVYREFSDSDDPVLKRIFNAEIRNNLKPHECVDKAWEIGGVEGVTHSYLIGGRYLL